VLVVASFLIVVVLEIVTGLYLVKSLEDIRFFFVNSQATDHLDVKQMVLHGCAFGCFLLAILVFALAYTLSWVVQTQWTLSVYEFALLFQEYANFASQCLLVIVFWKLGTKEKESLEEQQEEDEASLNARIWQQFQLKLEEDD
jgi:hypothetical protein